MRYTAIELFLSRKIVKMRTELFSKPHRIVFDVYGGGVHVKEGKYSGMNLSKAELSESLFNIFALGMNFHLLTKIDPLHSKVQVEKLYEDVKNKVNGDIVKIEDDSLLKTELKDSAARLYIPIKTY